MDATNEKKSTEEAMAKKRETRRQQKIQKLLRKEFGRDIWFFKVHGGPFQMAGVPDILGCLRGIFFGFEVKEEDGELSDIQIEVMWDIRRAGGVARSIIDPQEAVSILRKALDKAEGGGRLRAGSRSNGVVLRAANGKDVHNDGRA